MFELTQISQCLYPLRNLQPLIIIDHRLLRLQILVVVCLLAASQVTFKSYEH